MPRKPNYGFEKRKKEAARQRRKAEKQNGKQNKRNEAEKDGANTEQPLPPKEPATGLPE